MIYIIRCKVHFDNGREKTYYLFYLNKKNAERDYNQVCEVLTSLYTDGKSGHLRIRGNIVNVAKTSSVRLSKWW